MKSSVVIFVLMLSGCSGIRMAGVVETDAAIYGSTTISKNQDFDAKNFHLSAFEALMATISPENLEAIAKIIAASPIPLMQPEPPASVTAPGDSTITVNPPPQPPVMIYPQYRAPLRALPKKAAPTKRCVQYEDIK